MSAKVSRDLQAATADLIGFTSSEQVCLLTNISKNDWLYRLRLMRFILISMTCYCVFFDSLRVI